MPSDDLVHHEGRAALDLLDDAALATAVAELGTDGMQALVARVGLADAGHWLALATPEQVLAVLDAELWLVPRAGQDERFDAGRFLTWLEALVEVDPALAADRLAEAPQELVVLGLFRQALVFDTDELWLAVARGLMDPAIDDQPQLELGDHLVVGRGLDGWDALVQALAELADRHPTDLDALLDRCRELTDRLVADQGLRDALLDEGEAEEEAALEREDRRAREGFVAPHAARSFLALATDVDLETQRAFVGRDPVAAAYFRDWDHQHPPSAQGVARAGLAGARPEELGFLVQVVLAGCVLGGRAPTLEEAARAVLAVCRVGEAVVGPAGTTDALFRFGYHVVHHRIVRRARRLRDRSGLADDVPSLDGRFLSGPDDLDRAVARLDAIRR
ncbi:MAG: hypothetical protein H6738_04215 [Alphaproteobacteria bacterium]|nr:hypothetical protein [Alphaproteobacteria bacterium]MCB9695976.1 hypothetical protein [Alphaproteobacteria bacterium]